MKHITIPSDADLDTALLVADQIAHSTVRVLSVVLTELKNIRAAFPATSSEIVMDGCTVEGPCAVFDCDRPAGHEGDHTAYLAPAWSA